MEYTIDDLLSFIERHDEHEGYYREQLIRKVKAEEQRRILGGLLRLPITRTQAWDRGWYSVSITDAISVVRDEQP